MTELKTKLPFINYKWLGLFFILAARILLSTPKFSAGDMLLLSGNILREPIALGVNVQVRIAGIKVLVPKEAEINYGDYLEIKGVYEEGQVTHTEIIKHTKSRFVLFAIREKLLKFYRSSVSEPYASLIAGVVLGAKSDLPKETRDMLNVAGVSHVVVASGFNVSLVAAVVLSIFLALYKRRRAIILTLVGIWLYVLLAGVEGPLIRAAFMVSITLLAQSTGRISHALKALMVSAFIMLLISPYWIYDVGFQLSFCATSGLILFESKIRKFVRFLPSIFAEGLSTSLAAQIGVFPLLVLFFGRVSLIGPIVNAFVLWTIPLITIIGAAAGAIGLVNQTLGKLILMLALPLTWYFWKVIEIVT